MHSQRHRGMGLKAWTMLRGLFESVANTQCYIKNISICTTKYATGCHDTKSKLEGDVSTDVQPGTESCCVCSLTATRRCGRWSCSHVFEFSIMNSTWLSTLAGDIWSRCVRAAIGQACIRLLSRYVISGSNPQPDLTDLRVKMP